MTHAADIDRHYQDRLLILGIVLLAATYGITLAWDVPQAATRAIVAAEAAHGAETGHADGSAAAPGAAPHAAAAPGSGAAPAADGAAAAGEQTDPAEHAATSAEHAAHADPTEREGHAASVHGHPPYWTVIPFLLLLGAIAVLPLVPATAHWWESNRSRFFVAAVLGLGTLAYYALLHEHPVAKHFAGHGIVEPISGGPSWLLAWTIVENALLNEYVPFIVLLLSLYTIAGGIRIQGDIPARPLTNTAFLAAGGLIASFVGTTGAAMLLIRPLLETNSERRHVRHTVVFFIFIVCNCGGLLLPIGDPPLFLGYLAGVDFLWTLRLWPEWLLANGMLLAVYYIWDRFAAYPREQRQDIVVDELRTTGLVFRGLWPNLPLLAGVVLATALLSPTKTFPGTDWHPWLYLRELVQLVLVGLSLLLGSSAVRDSNRFTYDAIIEVAALFFGIFLCMQPALQILSVQGPSLGIDSPLAFYWITGALSSVLDNAPTYMVFFETARSLPSHGETLVAGVTESRLAAISLGAVFMGANTYIGNGPNFMVKTIAERSGVRMPSFFGYMVYSGLVLLPILAICGWIATR